MAKLRAKLTFETTFASYIADEIIGEGGAGRVYSARDNQNQLAAIKVLTHASKDKRQRFKNEIAFLGRNKHPNIVSVTDHGLADGNPFYVMRQYDCSLRSVMKTRTEPPGEDTLQIFSKMLDGVEAAHLLGAIHRDLKPENILIDRASNVPAVADFGIASFTDDLLVTLVKTEDTQRLANFVYAAPEQRAAGRNVRAQADVYALGLILNELFTGETPHGTDYKAIESANPNFAFLDPIVAKMIRQNADERYNSIEQVKQAIAQHRQQFITLQRLSAVKQTVIPQGEIDDSLAFDPVRIINFDWANNVLTLVLDRPVHDRWVYALHNMGSYSSVWGKGPETFNFRGDTARVSAQSNEVQRLIDHFKEWAPRATARLKHDLEQELTERRGLQAQQLQAQRNQEETRLKLLNTVKL